MNEAINDILVCLKNTDRQGKGKRSLDIKQRAHLCELAHALCRGLPNDSDNGEAEELRHRYLEYCKVLDDEDRRILCGYLAEEAPRVCSELLELKYTENTGTAVYVKNALSDIAFSSFSEAFERLQIYYADDFEAALEDVYYSRADYTILPISSSRNGMMLHFLELILRYEMKIILSCNVHSIADDSENRFLLLSRNNTELAGDGSKISLEFILRNAREQIPYVMNAAASYGAALEFVQSLPDGETALMRYDVSAGGANALILYLFLETSGYIPMGIYKTL